MKYFENFGESEEFVRKSKSIESFYRRIQRMKREIRDYNLGKDNEDSFFEFNNENNLLILEIIDDINKDIERYEKLDFEQKKANVNKLYKRIEVYLPKPMFQILEDYKKKAD